MAMDEEDMEVGGKDTLLPSTEEDIQRFSNIFFLHNFVKRATWCHAQRKKKKFLENRF